MTKHVSWLDFEMADYKKTWDLQQELNNKLVQAKREGKDIDSHYLIACQHTPVYTLGKSGSESHLRYSKDQLDREGIEYFKINRGGDITYHGPGQLVIYPILDLDHFFTDIHRYVRSLEEVVIRTLSVFGLEGTRLKDFTGVWLDGEPKRKLCAIGVHLSRWVTMHGLALNVNPNLVHFNGIIPCGIDARDKSVTSMQKELGRALNIEHVKAVLIDQFEEVFECQIERKVWS